MIPQTRPSPVATTSTPRPWLPDSIGSAERLAVDHAVFTSVRSSTGAGYRIIAATPGVTAEEKAEITRRSPSHDSLCDPSPQAIGLISYYLESGRMCVGLVRHAGKEHTARGGYRVHTHMAVLDRGVDDQFGCDPVRVHAVLSAVLIGEPLLKPPPCFEPLHLPLVGFAGILKRLAIAGLDATDAIVFLAHAMLRTEQVMFLGATDELALLEEVIVSLPHSARRGLAVSTGLKPAPARQIHLTLLGMDRSAAQRALRGSDAIFFDAASIPQTPPTAYAAWLEFLRRWHAAGRLEDIERLTRQMADPMNPADLSRIASLSNDLGSIDTACVPALESLLNRACSAQPASALEEEIVTQIREKAIPRLGHLTSSAQPASITGGARDSAPCEFNARP